ncbi:unnamed protein product [Medioppia subpectinata]|uniref:Uncharacterized protein n=1 Tax=Medioppia subpectinata TaxID=1979941 RepID=A0A7R9LY63_9ACAR|nr:unnamed protein product [Medioppia subpectinata]CAG2122483.1 unnamed protein product [Medioppia subpectinata]
MALNRFYVSFGSKKTSMSHNWLNFLSTKTPSVLCLSKTRTKRPPMTATPKRRIWMSMESLLSYLWSRMRTRIALNKSKTY